MVPSLKFAKNKGSKPKEKVIIATIKELNNLK